MADGSTCFRGCQGDTPIICHVPCKRRILRTAVNLKRLVEFVVKHSQRHVARVIGFGLHCNQGTVEGFAVLSSVLIFELFVPQSDDLLFQLLLAGGYGGVVVRRARCENTCAADKGGGKHPFRNLIHYCLLMFICSASFISTFAGGMSYKLSTKITLLCEQTKKYGHKSAYFSQQRHWGVTVDNPAQYLQEIKKLQ